MTSLLRSPWPAITAVLAASACGPTAPPPIQPAPTAVVVREPEPVPAPVITPPPRGHLVTRVLAHREKPCDGDEGLLGLRLDGHVVLHLGAEAATLNIAYERREYIGEPCPGHEDAVTTERWVWRGQAEGTVGGFLVRFGRRSHARLVDDQFDEVDPEDEAPLVLTCEPRVVKAHEVEPDGELDDVVAAPETPQHDVSAWACTADAPIAPGLAPELWHDDGALVLSEKPGLDHRHAAMGDPPEYTVSSTRLASSHPLREVQRLHAVWEQYFCRSEGNTVPLAHPCKGLEW